VVSTYIRTRAYVRERKRVWVSDVCAFTFKDAASNRRERERWGGGRKRNATIGRKKKRKRERETETKRKRERGGREKDG